MALYQQLSPRTSVLNPTDHYEYYKMVDSSMMSLYPDADAVKSLHMLINDVGEQNQRKEQLEKRTGIGAIAPEIALPNPKGDTLRLSSTRGKYVLLDFWASWCQPCRNENPNLLRLYWRYKYNGFEIFQVSLDKTKESWIKGITDDKLAWINVSDLKFWNSPVVALYGIESIPYNLLLDTKGEIIGKDLQGEKLASKLREIFKY
jgi:thiol-disulfide isomerase/thioredoxin